MWTEMPYNGFKSTSATPTLYLHMYYPSAVFQSSSLYTLLPAFIFIVKVHYLCYYGSKHVKTIMPNLLFLLWTSNKDMFKIHLKDWEVHCCLIYFALQSHFLHHGVQPLAAICITPLWKHKPFRVLFVCVDQGFIYNSLDLRNYSAVILLERISVVLETFPHHKTCLWERLILLNITRLKITVTERFIHNCCFLSMQEGPGGLWDSVKKAAFVIGSGILFLAAFGNSLTW